MLVKVAITGGVSSGKSTVCRILKQSGAYVVSADKIVHNLLSSHLLVKKKVIKLLGREIVTRNRIDRKKVAHIVFTNPKKLKALEKILHPFIKRKIKELYNSTKKSTLFSLFVAEVPLLYEAKMENFFDFVIAVVSDPKSATLRFIKKHESTEEEFLKRTNNQMSISQKTKKADLVLVNNSTLHNLKKNTYHLISQIQRGVL